jgi:hypothetical protein
MLVSATVPENEKVIRSLRKRPGKLLRCIRGIFDSSGCGEKVVACQQKRHSNKYRNLKMNREIVMPRKAKNTTWFTETYAQGRRQQQGVPLQEAIYCNKHEQKVKKTIRNEHGSSPQLGGLVIASSRKIRRRWMKRDTANTVAVWGC